MSIIKSVKIKEKNGQMSQPIQIGAEASNVVFSNGSSLESEFKKLTQDINLRIPTIRSGHGLPDNSVGKDGDIYIQFIE